MAAINSSRLAGWNMLSSDAISVSACVSSESPRFSSSSKKPGRITMRAGSRADVASGGELFVSPSVRSESSSCT